MCSSRGWTPGLLVGGGIVSGGGRYADGTRVRVTAEDTDEWWFNRWEVFATRSPRSVTVTERSVDYYCDVIGCRDDEEG